MQIDYLSDLHIDKYVDKNELLEDRKFDELFDPIITKDNRRVGDVLVIAGDLGINNNQNLRLLKFLKSYYSNIICVLGNVDYHLVDSSMVEKYKTSFKRVEEMRMLINKEKNLYCLNGNSVEIDGIRFGGADSWYDGSYNDLKEKFNYETMNDFWKARTDDAKYIYGVEYFDDIYSMEEKKVRIAYAESDVMITHVSPAKLISYIPDKYLSVIASFYTFDGWCLRYDGAKHWIFGHFHEAIEYQFPNSECLCKCNPFGLPFESNYGKNVVMKSFEI